MRLSVLAFVLLFSPEFTLAKAEGKSQITIAGTDIPGLFDEKSPGAYDIIFGKLTDSIENINIIRGPMLRMQRMFTDRKVGCLFVGGTIDSYSDATRNAIIFSEPLKVIPLRLYTKPNQPKIQSLDELRGKTVVFASSFSSVEEDVGLFAKNNIKTLRVEKNTQAFQLLEFGRVAAVAAYEIDVQFLAKYHSDVAQYTFSKDFRPMETEDLMMCWKSPETISFIKKFNSKLLKMKDSGAIDAILAN